MPARFKNGRPPRPRNHRRADPWSSLGHRQVEQAPDREPVEQLRAALERFRAEGWGFEDAWRAATAAALVGLTGRDRTEEAETLDWALPYWRAAFRFEDERGPCGLHASLLD